VIAGCSDGFIRIFKREDKPDETKEDVQPVFGDFGGKQVSKKALTHVVVIDPLDMVVCATADAHVTVWDLNNFNQLASLDVFKETKIYQIEPSPLCKKPSTSIPAISKRGSTISKTQKTSRFTNSFSIAICTKGLVLIYRWDFHITQFVLSANLPVPDKVRTLSWAGERILVGFKEEYNFIHLDTGEVKQIPQISIGKGNSVSCLIRLTNNTSGDADVHVSQEIMLVKENQGICIGIDGTIRYNSLRWKSSPSDIAFSFPYILALHPDYVDVRSLFTDTVAAPIPIKGAFKIIAKEEQPLVFVACSSKLLCLFPVPLLDQINSLLKAKHFEDALALCDRLPDTEKFLKKKEEKRKEVNTLYAYALFNDRRYMKAIQHFQGNCDARNVLSLFPQILPPGQDAGIVHPIDILPIPDDEINDALAALIPFLYHMRARFEPATRSATGVNPSVFEDEIKGTDTEQGLLKGIFKGKDPAESKMTISVLVDTMLLHSYLLTGEGLVLTFLTSPNKCDVKETERILLENGLYKELICFFNNRGLHRDALKLLKAYSDHKDVHHPLYGTSETIDYLKVLVLNKLHTDLVLEYSQWVLLKDPDNSLEIFSHGLRSQEYDSQVAMSPSVILAHLEKYGNIHVRLGYLETLIETNHTQEKAHFNKLAFAYLENILDLMKKSKADSNVYCLAGTEPGMLGVNRKRLIKFLKESKYISPEVLIASFPPNLLLEERAMLYGRMKQVQQAFEIYVQKLKQHFLADEFCDYVYDRPEEYPVHCKTIYLDLYSLYLSPTDKSIKPNIENALELLNRRGDRMNASAALKLLPESVSLSKILPFYERVSAQYSEIFRNAQIRKSLRKAEHLDVQVNCSQARLPHFVVDQRTVCSVCNQKINQASTIVIRYPNGVLIDYKCLKDRYVCPITRRRFGYEMSDAQSRQSQ
jgi:tetratricopeptide (TPR) repeat protein